MPKNLITLITQNNVKLLWTPGYREITGNERFDSPIKKGAKATFHLTRASINKRQRSIVDEAKTYEKMGRTN